MSTCIHFSHVVTSAHFHVHRFIASLRGHISAVYQISWSADSRLLCSGSSDSTLKVGVTDHTLATSIALHRCRYGTSRPRNCSWIYLVTLTRSVCHDVFTSLYNFVFVSRSSLLTGVQMVTESGAVEETESSKCQLSACNMSCIVILLSSFYQMEKIVHYLSNVLLL